jgi:hypothetical protein
LGLNNLGPTKPAKRDKKKKKKRKGGKNSQPKLAITIDSLYVNKSYIRHDTRFKAFPIYFDHLKFFILQVISA